MAKTRTSFKPGQSGNPGGRPKTGKAFRDIFNDLLSRKSVVMRDKTGKAVETLSGKEIIAAIVYNIATNQNNPPQVQLQAVNLMMDRMEGKALQTVAADVETVVLDKTKIIKADLDKLSPSDREMYLEICERQNDTDSQQG